MDRQTALRSGADLGVDVAGPGVHCGGQPVGGAAGELALPVTVHRIGRTVEAAPWPRLGAELTPLGELRRRRERALAKGWRAEVVRIECEMCWMEAEWR